MSELAVHRGDVVLRARVEGAGPDVLLLHGLGEDLDVWWERGWVAALAARRRVIAFDARGHGRSSKPHGRERYRASDRVADACAVLDAVGAASIDVVGYSMGAWTALYLARDAPARVRCIVAGGAPAGGQSLAALRGALAAGLPALLSAVEGQCGPLPAAVRTRFLANDVAALAAICADDRVDLTGDLAGAPIAFFAAERDPLRDAIEAGARRLERPCRIVPGCDHFDLAVRAAALPLVVEALDRG
jgi:pimeloyl-ACP methyl ester carboxylesterase